MSPNVVILPLLVVLEVLRWRVCESAARTIPGTPFNFGDYVMDYDGDFVNIYNPEIKVTRRGSATTADNVRNTDTAITTVAGPLTNGVVSTPATSDNNSGETVTEQTDDRVSTNARRLTWQPQDVVVGASTTTATPQLPPATQLSTCVVPKFLPRTDSVATIYDTRIVHPALYAYTIDLPWQTVTVYADHRIEQTDLGKIHQSMHSTFADIVTIFQPTVSECWRFKVRELNLYVLLSETIYKSMVHPHGENTCGVFTGHTEAFVWRLGNGCKSYLDTVKHEYAHYLDYTYLHTQLHRPSWWAEGLATYVSDVCYNNSKYSGTEGLKAMLSDSGVSNYEKGSIMHGFLDTTQVLRNYHRQLWTRIYTNALPLDFEDEIISKFGCMFKATSYCESYKIPVDRLLPTLDCVQLAKSHVAF